MFSRTLSRLSLTAKVAVVIVSANLAGLALTTWLSWSADLETGLSRAESEWTKATEQFGATAEGAVKWKKAAVIQEAYAMYREKPELALNAFLALNAKKEVADSWSATADSEKSFAERALALIDKAPEKSIVDKSASGEMLIVSPLGLDKAGKRIGYVAASWSSIPVVEASRIDALFFAGKQALVIALVISAFLIAMRHFAGKPLAMPRLDMVTGLYHLTRHKAGDIGEGHFYSSPAEALMAFDRKVLGLQAMVKIRVSDKNPPKGAEPEGWEPGQPWLAETTLGRVLFNEILPQDYAFINEVMPKKRQAVIINDLAERYPMVTVARTLDKLKDAGFHWATRSGVTVAISDVLVPAAKQDILEEHERLADAVEKRYQRGQLSHEERNSELVKVWTKATEQVHEIMEDNFPEDNSIRVIVQSGAAGNMTQVRSLAGMRGLVTNPKGEYIPRPIKNSFREGLSVLEYFIATHGARKGLADTALRTADSGYLTRRLVDVSQDVIIREVDCGTTRGVNMTVGEKLGDKVGLHEFAQTSVYARTVADDILDASGNLVLNRGDDLGDPALERLVEAGIIRVKVRSVLTCESAVGVCASCYGRSMATGQLVDVGEAVGIVAAQSIGEPGTQLTMRTFHQGGVAGDDITTGLPRVQELFEARVPKGKAPIADVDGRVRIEDGDRFWKITLIPDDGSEEIVFEKLSKRQRLANTATGPLQDGDHVAVGQQLLEGTPDPHEVLRVMGPREAQLHLVQEVQKVYRAQGVAIHDKHIEVIVRQMLRRVTIIDSGVTEFLPGSLVERADFESGNRAVVAEGGEPAAGRPVLMGITKASLATDSWLSAASFQETTRVLTDAAINGRSDKLIGLKENVIIGKLIPAGTGINRYRNIQVQPTEEARAAAYAIPSYDDGYYTPDVFGTGTGAAVPLDDYDFGRDYR